MTCASSSIIRLHERSNHVNQTALWTMRNFFDFYSSEVGKLAGQPELRRYKSATSHLHRPVNFVSVEVIQHIGSVRHGAREFHARCLLRFAPRCARKFRHGQGQHHGEYIAALRGERSLGLKPAVQNARPRIEILQPGFRMGKGNGNLRACFSLAS